MGRIRFAFAVASLLAVTAMPMRTVAEPAPAPAPKLNNGGPDGYGYKYIDNQGADDPASGGGGTSFASVFQDISSSGTALSGVLSDDITTSFTPTCMIRYYGQNWGTAPAGSGAAVVSPLVYVSSNGNLQFLNSGQSASTSYSNGSLPAAGMNGMVAFMWDDCYGASAGNACYWQVVGSAPNRRLIVQYNSWDWCCSDGPNMQFQIQFTESDGTSDSTIYLVYSDITNSDGRECGNSATIGIQSPTQQYYLQYSLNTASIADDRVIRFYTNSPPNPPSNPEQAGSPGGTAIPAGGVMNGTAFVRATVTDPNAGNTIGLQAELLPASTPFQAGITGLSVQTPAGSLVANNGIAELSFAGIADGSYHWRVRAFDNLSTYSTWVEFNLAGASFHVDTSPPSAPGGPLSPNGELFNNPNGAEPVTLQWGPATDVGPAGFPLEYILELAFDPTFATVSDTIVLTGTSRQSTFGASEKTYYWRVSAIDAAGNQGPFAGPASFKVEAPSPEEPPDDILPCSAGVTTAGLTPLLGLLIAGTLLIRRCCKR